MLKKQTIYCDICSLPVCEGWLFKKLLKPYCVIPCYERLIILDAWGMDITDKRVKEENHLCVDCYNKLVIKLRKEMKDGTKQLGVKRI